MRFLILIFASSVASAWAFDPDHFLNAAKERRNNFVASDDLGMMSTVDSYTPLNDTDWISFNDTEWVPYDEEPTDRGFSTRVTCGSRRTIRSRTFPNRYAVNEWEFFQFIVAPNVRFVLTCSSVNVPGPDNALLFNVLTSSNKNLINSVTFSTGGSTESRTFARRDVLSQEIQIYLGLLGTSVSSRRGTGFNCVATGECGSNPPTTVSPPTTTVAPPPGGLSCGQCAGSRKLDSVDRIIQGNFANNDKYCFMARLHGTNSGPNSPFCGATLISPTAVVTAAHCVDSIGSAGILSVSFNCDLGQCSQTLRASSIAVHPGWIPNDSFLCSNGNDIAVVRLSGSVSISGSINQVCLPRQGQCPSVGSRVQTAGYGRTSATGPGSLRLKEADIRIVNCGCTGRVACAQQITGRTCNGDSGSFMGSISGGRWTIHGVTSFGGPSCNQQSGMGFSEVCNFVSWVVSNAGGGTQVTG